MKTEEEARNTRCCGPDFCGQMRTNKGGRCCVASECMAWRSVEKIGYCGLAGLPEKRDEPPSMQAVLTAMGAR